MRAVFPYKGTLQSSSFDSFTNFCPAFSLQAEHAN